MDAVNQLIEQTRAFFASMTPGARLTAGLLMAVVVVSVAYLFQQSTAGPDAYLFGAAPLQTSELIAAEAAIAKAGLSDYQIEGNKIRVPSGKKHLYVAAVAADNAIPPDVMDHMQQGLDGGGWTDSREVKQARLRAARERQLSQIVTDMPWVSRGAVLYSEEKLRGLSSRNRVAATVSVMPLGSEALDSRRVRMLQRLVAGFHPSLAPDQVTVIDQSDNSTHGGGDADPNEFNDPYHQTLVAFENRVRNNIIRHLNYIPGVRVQVSATLDTRITSQVRTTKPEKDPLYRTTVEQIESTTQNTTDAAGRPGQVANSANAVGPEGPNRTNSSKVENRLEEASARYADTTTVEQLAGLAPREVQASIEVPRDYVVDVYKQRKLLETGEAPDTVDPGDLKLVEAEVVGQIEGAVESMLPDPSGVQDEYKFVNVVVVDTVAAQPIPEPSAVSEAMFFASKHASTAAMVVLGVVGLMMLRSVVTGAPKGDDTAGVLPSLELQTPDGEPVAPSTATEDDDDRPKLQLKKPNTLKDDLATIVRDDPDAAAAILRSWIGAAS
ncbi:MAG: hypothetical protein AAGG46_00580 [Planctomycetota bacterium]